MLRARKLFWLAASAALLAGACGGEGDGAKTPEAPAAAAAATKPAEDEIPKGDAGRRLYFEKRCNEGHAGLCGELGLMWERGWGGEKDKKKADEYYRKACDEAVVESCEALGINLTTEQAVAILDKKCAAGSAFACNNLGQVFLAGADVVADPAKALPLLEKGCAGGYPTSCRSLATMWAEGLGVSADPEKEKAYKAKADAADAVIRALEVKYLHLLSRDEMPVGHASPGLVQSLRSDRADQNELNEKVLEGAKKKGAQGAAATPVTPAPEE